MKPNFHQRRFAKKMQDPNWVKGYEEAVRLLHAKQAERKVKSILKRMRKYANYF